MTSREPRPRPRRARAAATSPWLIALTLAVASGGSVSQASAQQSNIVQDPQNDPCAPNFASITAAQQTLTLGQSTTLDWTVLIPSHCAMPMLYLRNSATAQSMPVDAVDGTVVAPTTTTTYTVGTLQLDLAPVTVTVAPPSPGGLPVVTITANNQQGLLVQALGSPGTEVIVQDHVEMDLSAYHVAIPIAYGVRLRGGRSGRQLGARLYIRPDAQRLNGEPLFKVMGHGVNITGLRIDGGHDGSSGPSHGIGIFADSRLALGIARNEIYGWAFAAVELSDREELADFVLAPVIDGNYVHHNANYGVYASNGAIVEIHANVFDANGLAISADGAPRSGYTAWANLVLEHSGGFDAAGEYFAVSRNAFYNASGPAFNLRGTASWGAFVRDNTYGGPGVLPHEYTGSGIYLERNNRLAAEQGACDFDGDGRDDLFLTTGRTWWINNGGDRDWVYLRFVRADAHELMASDVSLGDVTGDGKCDVSASGTILYTTDRSPVQSPGTTSREPQ